MSVIHLAPNPAKPGIPRVIAQYRDEFAAIPAMLAELTMAQLDAVEHREIGRARRALAKRQMQRAAPVDADVSHVDLGGEG